MGVFVLHSYLRIHHKLYLEVYMCSVTLFMICDVYVPLFLECFA